MKIIAIGLGFTKGDAKLSHAIAWLTAPWKWRLSLKRLAEVCSHVFIWFRKEDGSVWYFEALISNGWKGPKPVEKVLKWSQVSPDRWVRFFELWTYPDLGMQAAWSLCHEKLGVWSYAEKQLRLMPRTQWLGRRLVGPTPNEVICSEAASRILYAGTCRCDFRKFTKRKAFDWIAPQSMMEACMRIPTIDDVTDEMFQALENVEPQKSAESAKVPDLGNRQSSIGNRQC